MDIAIIGAGMAGLTCARRLSGMGHTVRVFDKGRGPGGRMSSRRVELDGKTLRFDHGAQYFTVHDERFRRQVEEWEADEIVAPWPAAKEGPWVGIPAMNAPIRAMAAEAEVRFGARIDSIRKVGTVWRLSGEGAPDTGFDAVISAVPAEQVAPLLSPNAPDIAQLAEATTSEPCWTVMVAFEDRPDLADTIRHAGPIGWAARNSSKPGRGEGECWVVQGSPEWSRENLEAEKEAIETLLLEQLRNLAGGTLPAIRHASAHRWRYAMCGDAGVGAIWNGNEHIGACGDWLHGPRAENAFLSGWELAQKVIDEG
ncbi:NAD(P)/FAD-dependent oxidoreductase [Aurantiacibacter poecillastricola]|uniref:NAD(P)/FAD-dependent oxidoreductase n=1 Tax=Aurantiacibacter poecillastricola TaxID=3064385 RepID=UPI00273FB7C4|nr:FAD-dependent oxidoreductase [Aurantiacibacter sp. 219JJ12-13]MDP5262640.1 FAD-dependent oxidoreductase [Aurantiacibacter sp. 219JJ12-13]